MSDFSERVHRIVRGIPRGRVASYGGVAALAGAPRSARGVGSALRALPDGAELPWWRVVNGRGEVALSALGQGSLQRELLRREGVRFGAHGRIDLRRYGWPADADE